MSLHEDGWIDDNELFPNDDEDDYEATYDSDEAEEEDKRLVRGIGLDEDDEDDEWDEDFDDDE